MGSKSGQQVQGRFIEPQLIDPTVRGANNLAFTATAGAEAADAIPIAVTGPNSGIYLLEVRDNTTNVVELQAVYTATDVGAGTQLTDDGTNASHLFQLSTAGAGAISINDIATTSTETLRVILTPQDFLGPTLIVSITFA